jgi:hypothetical protein
MHALLIASLLALILTKAADVITTWGGLRRSGVHLERNPFARNVMRKIGLAKGLAAVLMAWVTITSLVYIPAWSAPAWYQLAVSGLGFLIAWAQADVARSNATGSPSAFTRVLGRWYDFRRPGWRRDTLGKSN